MEECRIGVLSAPPRTELVSRTLDLETKAVDEAPPMREKHAAGFEKAEAVLVLAVAPLNIGDTATAMMPSELPVDDPDAPLLSTPERIVEGCSTLGEAYAGSQVAILQVHLEQSVLDRCTISPTLANERIQHSADCLRIVSEELRVNNAERGFKPSMGTRPLPQLLPEGFRGSYV